jgi:hypothetical protein
MLIRLSFLQGLIFLLVINAHAQVTVGVKIGPDFSRLLDALEASNGGGGNVLFNTTTRTYFYGGIFVDVPLEKRGNFYLRPQLLYVGMGGQTPTLLDYNGNAVAVKTQYSLNYLDLPLQLLYSPTLTFGKPWIGAGLYAGTLLSGTEKSGFNSSPILIGDKPIDEVERYDFGYSLTAGLTLKCHVLIGADFQQGLTRISPPVESGSGSTRLNTRTSVWGIHIGYEIPVKH